jgi:hypothetical protein
LEVAANETIEVTAPTLFSDGSGRLHITVQDRTGDTRQFEIPVLNEPFMISIDEIRPGGTKSSPPLPISF